MPFRTLLRSDLAEAKKARDKQKASLIRTLITSLENAEAVDSVDAGGATEVPRRRLSTEDISAIIRNERDELLHAAEEYAARGHVEEAQRLRALSDVADSYARRFDGG